jgi:hypothetical protein
VLAVLAQSARTVTICTNCHIRHELLQPAHIGWQPTQTAIVWMATACENSTSSQTALTLQSEWSATTCTNLQSTRTAGIESQHEQPHAVDVVRLHDLPLADCFTTAFTSCYRVHPLSQSALITTACPNWQPGRTVTVCVNCQIVQELFPAGRYGPIVI